MRNNLERKCIPEKKNEREGMNMCRNRKKNGD